MRSRRRRARCRPQGRAPSSRRRSCSATDCRTCAARRMPPTLARSSGEMSRARRCPRRSTGAIGHRPALRQDREVRRRSWAATIGGAPHRDIQVFGGRTARCRDRRTRSGRSSTAVADSRQQLVAARVEQVGADAERHVRADHERRRARTAATRDRDGAQLQRRAPQPGEALEPVRASPSQRMGALDWCCPRGSRRRARS